MELDKSVLITGCSSGIGWRCAQLFKQDGFTVFATARKSDDVARLKEQGFEHALQLDVCNAEHIDSVIDYIKTKNQGRLGVLFNNAGYSQIAVAEDLTHEALQEQFNTNFFAVCELTRRVLPLMHCNDNGRIIMNSSVFGLTSSPFRAAYCSSKYALEAYTDCLRLELRMIKSNIAVSLIEPGPVVSRIRQNKKLYFERYVDVERSYYAEFYKNITQGLAMSGRIPFTVEPDVVYKKISHCINSKRPKARYYVTTLTYIVAVLKRLLPTQWMDGFTMRVIAKKEIGKELL